MRRYIKTISLVVLPAIAVLGFALLQLNAAPEEDCMRIRIWCDRDEYIPHEPILIKYEIYNPRSEDVITNYWLLKEYFHIMDDKGRGYNCIVRSDSELSDILHPGEILADSDYIQFGYQTYNVAVYECYMDIPGELVVPQCPHNMKSNTIKFTVKEPVGEDRQALDLFRRADSLGRVAGLDKSTRRRNKFDAYLDLAARYPNSIYAPISLHAALLMESVPQDKAVLISIGKRLVEDYPNTPYGAWAYQDLIKAYRLSVGLEAAKEYFNSLREKYPNSEIARRAEHWLGIIEKGVF